MILVSLLPFLLKESSCPDILINCSHCRLVCSVIVDCLHAGDQLFQIGKIPLYENFCQNVNKRLPLPTVPRALSHSTRKGHRKVIQLQELQHGVEEGRPGQIEWRHI